MPDNRHQISIGIIEELKRQGLNQSQIAELFDVTRQAVSYHKVVYNGTLTPREEVKKHFPWKISSKIQQQSPCRRLRDHAEYMATGGKGMSKFKLERLRAFYKKLIEEDVVVEYNPLLPPIPGVANLGGFAFRPRIKRDGDLIIRKNPWTTLTPEGRMIWRMPPTLP